MNSVVLSEWMANAVWDVCVFECGAEERSRDTFVHSVTNQGLSEYRFRGHLGAGGKVWAKLEAAGLVLYVNYYGEDETEDRKTRKEAANASLALFSKDPLYTPVEIVVPEICEVGPRLRLSSLGS
jgi:hypothetical protein